MSAPSSWRERAAPIIARVLRETAGQPDGDIKRALRDAYPFGERRYHPYKVWLDEVKNQRGKRSARVPSGDDAERAREMFRAAGKPVPAWLGGPDD